MTVYLDHNATTPLRPEVRELLLRELDGLQGNPSSLHAGGRRARALLDQARERVAGALSVHEEEVIFTGSGTEANNLALLGALGAAGAGAALAVGATEHSSVLGPAAALEAAGHPVLRIGVDAQGRLRQEELERALARSDLRILSLMAANNEVGVMAPLEQLATRLAERSGSARPLLHVDAVQALGRIPLHIGAFGAELLSLSAHKVGGPPGVGVLVRRRGLALRPLLFGGGQESELRPGTENAAAIAAAALAIELAVAEQADYAARVGALARELWRALSAALPSARLVGPPIEARDRIPNTLNVHVPGIDGRIFLARLDLEGLAVSAGSACASGALEASHVLRAMGMSDEAARASLRISLGRSTTRAEVDRAVEIMRRTALALCTTSE